MSAEAGASALFDHVLFIVWVCPSVCLFCFEMKLRMSVQACCNFTGILQITVLSMPGSIYSRDTMIILIYLLINARKYWLKKHDKLTDYYINARKCRLNKLTMDYNWCFPHTHFSVGSMSVFSILFPSLLPTPSSLPTLSPLLPPPTSSTPLTDLHAHWHAYALQPKKKQVLSLKFKGQSIREWSVTLTFLSDEVRLQLVSVGHVVTEEEVVGARVPGVVVETNHLKITWRAA